MIFNSIDKFFKDHVNREQIDREGTIPENVLQGLREMGLFGMTIPDKYGGFGLSATAYARTISRIATLDASIGVTLGAHQSIGLKGLLLFGTEEQKKRYLPDLATGKMIAAYALTEPTSGSDAYSIKSKAILSEDGSHYILNGGKIWITNGGIADFFTVFAKTPMEVENKKTGKMETKEKINCFIVTRDMAGFSNGEEEDKMGIRGSSTTSLYFDNVKVPKENLIGESGRGFVIAMEILNSGRLGLASGCVGGCKQMLKFSVQHATTRKQFDKPIIEFGMIKEKIGIMTMETYVLESMVYLTTGLIDAGVEDYSLESAICKIAGSETCWRHVDETLQIMGGSGYMREYPYEQAMRDTRINLIFEGTNEILRLFIALSGMKGVGEYLKIVGKALNDPIKSLGTLRDFAVRKITKTITRDRLTQIDELLAPEAILFEDLVANFASAVESLLRRHGKEIIKREFAQKRIANCAIDLYSMIATCSRVTKAIHEKGEDGASEEINICKTHCARAGGRVKKVLNQINENDDENIKEISSYAEEAGGYGY
jgi:acyl-CoA dehydrogenase family protein 9